MSRGLVQDLRCVEISLPHLHGRGESDEEVCVQV
jgi:hypothetical protein